MFGGKRRGRLVLISRIVAVLGAILGTTLPVFTPATATATTVQQRQRQCPPGQYRINERCVPFTTITKSTRVFLAFDQSGSATGFADFNQYKSYVQSKYNLTLTVQNGQVWWPGRGRGRGASQITPHQNKFAFFYDRGNFRGPAIALTEPDFYSDLRNVRRPGGGNWNNRISSIRTRGSGVSAAGAIVCLAPGCAVGSPVSVSTYTDLQLLGGLNNSISAVGVPF